MRKSINQENKSPNAYKLLDVPGACLIILTMVLVVVNLPLEGIALIAGIDRILDMMRTSVNIIGDASASAVVEASERKGDKSPA